MSEMFVGPVVQSLVLACFGARNLTASPWKLVASLAGGGSFSAGTGQPGA